MQAPVKFLLIVSACIALGFIFISLMPRPIPADLDMIGNGNPSAVFVYDLNLAVSNPQALEINKAREVLGESVNFLIVREGDPKTENFRLEHQAVSTELLFFSPKGELVDRKQALVSAEELVEIVSR